MPKDLVEVVNAYKQRTNYEELKMIEQACGGKCSLSRSLSNSNERFGGFMRKT